MSEISKENKVKPPFPALSSFQVVAIILSYFGLDDHVHKILALLNTNSSKYLTSHNEILKSFIRSWEPKIASVLQFAKTKDDVDCVFPMPIELKALPSYKKLKLRQINYK